MSLFQCRSLRAISPRTFVHSFRTSLFSFRYFLSQSPESNTEPEEPFIGPIDELRNERDLRMVVVKFKSLCGDINVRRCSQIYYETVRRLTAAKQFSLIEEILEDQKQYKCFTKEGFVSRIISLYGISTMFDHARKLFDEMHHLNCKRTVKSFNSLLNACLSSKNHDKIDTIFREIPLKLSITPNADTYNTVIRAYLEMDSLDSLLSVVDEMESNDVKPNSVTYSLVLEGLYRNGWVEDGDNVWKSMKKKRIEPCIQCYNSKLGLLVSQKRLKEAVDLFEEFVSNGCKPNAFTFEALFKGFREANNLEEAKKWYRCLPVYNCCANHLIYEILAAFAIQIGDFGFALEISRASIRAWCFIDEAILQAVLDGLVRESKVEEAKNLMDLAQKSNGVYGLQLKLPLMVGH